MKEQKQQNIFLHDFFNTLCITRLTLSNIPTRVTDGLITFYQSITPSAQNPAFTTTKTTTISFRWTCHCKTDIIVAYGGHRHIADIAVRSLGISPSVLGYFYLKGMLFSVSDVVIEFIALYSLDNDMIWLEDRYNINTHYSSISFFQQLKCSWEYCIAKSIRRLKA